jgi:hypothetical protein
MEVEEFICPITQSKMVDPVLGSDGNTYERSAITEWLRTHTTSPITREPMTAASLVPNYALRSMIQRHNAATVNSVVIAVTPTAPLAQAKKTEKTVKKPKQSQSQSQSQSTNSIAEDRQYAIRVQQEEMAVYKPLNAAPVTQQSIQAQQNAIKQKQIITALCLIAIFIIVLVIVIRIV